MDFDGGCIGAENLSGQAWEGGERGIGQSRWRTAREGEGTTHDEVRVHRSFKSSSVLIGRELEFNKKDGISYVI